MTRSKVQVDPRSFLFTPSSLRDRFRSLVERYVGPVPDGRRRITALCLFHPEKNPSLSIDLEKAVFHCFGCGVGEGVKRFAELVGEPWRSTGRESHTAQVRRACLQAEQQARAILKQRAEERDKQFCAEHRELYGEALAAADLLGLFHRRSDLAADFPELVGATHREYGNLLFRLSTLEARLDGEVE